MPSLLWKAVFFLSLFELFSVAAGAVPFFSFLWQMWADTAETKFNRGATFLLFYSFLKKINTAQKKL